MPGVELPIVGTEACGYDTNVTRNDPSVRTPSMANQTQRTSRVKQKETNASRGVDLKCRKGQSGWRSLASPISMALLDLDEPWKVLRRSDEWVLGPRAPYERVGDVSDVVFPTGATVQRETDQLNLYYGAADCTVAVATAKLSELIDYIINCPEVEA